MMRTFLLLWSGQFISLIGSGLTGFALGAWVFEQTGSATRYALISFFTSVPAIVVSPLVGALVDRWDRRRVMLLSDTGSALCTLTVVLLLLTGRIEIWHIYLTMAVSSLFGAFQWPAYSAATTLLVPKKHLGRAGGMVQLGQAVGQIISPMLAASLVGIIRLEGVILVDVATFVFAVLTLLVVRIPRPPVSQESEAARGSFLREVAFGWHYIVARRGLLSLLFLFAATNFALGVVISLFAPMVLSFSTKAALGSLLTVGGLGMLAGSLLMSAWGGPKRRVYGVLGFECLLGVFVVLAGLRASIPLLAVALFGGFFCMPLINGSSQAIWQAKTEPDVQGRVFSVRRAIAGVSLPLAYLIAGPLADYVFEPLLDAGGPLAGSAGRLIGVGPGRGIGLLFCLMGAAHVLVPIVGYFYPRLRLVEDELPDVVPDEPAGDEVG